jgi:hypothetical protein
MPWLRRRWFPEPHDGAVNVRRDKPLKASRRDAFNPSPYQPPPRVTYGGGCRG